MVVFGKGKREGQVIIERGKRRKPIGSEIKVTVQSNKISLIQVKENLLRLLFLCNVFILSDIECTDYLLLFIL